MFTILIVLMVSRAHKYVKTHYIVHLKYGQYIECQLYLNNAVKIFNLKKLIGTSLMVQWLRIQASSAGDMGSILGQETKIPHARGWNKKERKKERKTDKLTWLIQSPASRGLFQRISPIKEGSWKSISSVQLLSVWFFLTPWMKEHRPAFLKFLYDLRLFT